MPPQRHLVRSGQGTVRQRSQRACAPCRKRKIKCDGNQPCAACSGYGYECVYPEKETSTTSSTKSADSRLKSGLSSSEATREPMKFANAPEIPYVATETIIEPVGDPLIGKNLKTRFTSTYSAIAAPRILGISLDMPNPPRLQSFGWNPGTRPEAIPKPRSCVCDLISIDDMKSFATIYFQEVHPYFGIIDREMFLEGASSFWNSHKRGADFEAVICGVIALGSYFSGPASFHAENQIVEQGLHLVNFSISHPPALLSINHVVGWILRTIYLRSTTRPHLSWIASCTAVHIAESIGLHRGMNESQLTSQQVSDREVVFRLRPLWVAIGLNQFLSYEYGRTRVHLDLTACTPLAPVAGDLTAQTVAILRSVPGPQDVLGRGPELLSALKSATELPVSGPFLGLLRADACFCICWMLRSSNLSLSTTQIRNVLDAVRVAMDGAKFLVSTQMPWWNAVGTPFRAVGVLLELGTSDSLAMLPLVLETLKSVGGVFDSHLSREALTTALALVQGARDKRVRDLTSLDQGLGVIGDLPQPLGFDIVNKEMDFEWPMDMNMGGFAELEPWYGFDLFI
jgi:hypothetical protein